MHIVKISIGPHCTLEVTPELLARWFCEFNEEEQAQVFIECAAIGKQWDAQHREERAHGNTALYHGMQGQFYFVGSHLRTCRCSNDETRELIEELYKGMQHGLH